MIRTAPLGAQARHWTPRRRESRWSGVGVSRREETGSKVGGSGVIAPSVGSPAVSGGAWLGSRRGVTAEGRGIRDQAPPGAAARRARYPRPHAGGRPTRGRERIASGSLLGALDQPPPAPALTGDGACEIFPLEACGSWRVAIRAEGVLTGARCSEDQAPVVCVRHDGEPTTAGESAVNVKELSQEPRLVLSAPRTPTD